MTFMAVFADWRRSNRTLGPLRGLSQLASYSGDHKQAQYDYMYQIYRELQGKTALQASPYRATNVITRVTVINKLD